MAGKGPPSLPCQETVFLPRTPSVSKSTELLISHTVWMQAHLWADPKIPQMLWTRHAEHDALLCACTVRASGQINQVKCLKLECKSHSDIKLA